MGEAEFREIEQFLYREARLLDERRFGEWLDLFTEGARYRMSLRSNLYPRSSKAIAVLAPAPNDEAAEEDMLAVLDETKETLAGRIARLDTGMAWAEDPPSRTRHFVANIEIEPREPGVVEVRANFLVYKSRAETEQDIYIGSRRDTLHRVGGTLKIAGRRLILDQNVLLAKNVSIFF